MWIVRPWGKAHQQAPYRAGRARSGAPRCRGRPPPDRRGVGRIGALWTAALCLLGAAAAGADEPSGKGGPPPGAAATHAAAPSAGGPCAPGRPAAVSPSFALAFGDEVSPHPRIATSLMPGVSLDLEVVLTDPGRAFEATAVAGGRLRRLGPERWRFTASEEPGAVHRVRVREEGGEAICLVLFVRVPWQGQEMLRGYRLGAYPARPLRGDPAYARPPGFIEATAHTQDVWVTPHFQLREFVAKQAGGPPRYLLLDTRLLLKLEMLLEQVRRHGIPASSFSILSGYRTPFYNASIGNRTTYSRHAYGDAADIYVDEDGDGRMDDLDANAREGVGDARVLFELVESLHGRSWYMPFVGGLGLYGPKPHRGSFVHVDTRGTAARW